MKNLSLRIRLLLFFIGISCIVWLVAGAVSLRESREKIDEFFDQYQMLLARQLASADWSEAAPETQKQTNRIIDKIHDADEEDEAIGFAIFDQNGKRIFHDNENGRDFVWNPQIGRFANQKVDDEMWRIVWIRSADSKYVIAVGQELEYREEVAFDMAEEFLYPWLGGLIVLLMIVTWFIGREFIPLRKLAATLEHRRPDDLSPLDDGCLPAEIRPLTVAMNRMLKQIDRMIKREKSFISDSAHELRSPLTALKVQLEVLQLAENDPQTRNSAAAKMAQGIERCARLVEQLLLLSKLECGTATDTNDIVDWWQIIGMVADEYQEALKIKNQHLKTKVAENTLIPHGNALLLSAMLRNLVDNAVKYSPSDAIISIIVNETEITVCNSGITLKEQHLLRLSERFFRPAGQKESGSGLGLSIVRKIAALHGCRAEFANTDNGFQVSIILAKNI